MTKELDAESDVPSRILFTRLRSLGDTVLMTPIFTVMKRVPGWQVGVVIEAPYEQILENNPDVDHLFVIDNQPNKWRARLQVRFFVPLFGLGSASQLVSRSAHPPPPSFAVTSLRYSAPSGFRILW